MVIIAGSSSPAFASGYGADKLVDGHVTLLATVEAALTSGTTTIGWIQVQLDKAYSDIEMVSVWGGASVSSSAFSKGMSLFLSSGNGTAYNATGASYLCKANIWTAQSVEVPVWCSGYSGFSAEYVTLVRYANGASTRIGAQELRIWRGGGGRACTPWVPMLCSGIHT